MNRAQRRRQGHTGKVPTYTLNADQIEQLKIKAVNDAIDQAFILMLGLPMMALHDEFGFGKVRLEMCMNKIIDLYDSFNKGYITLDDLLTTIKEETGVVIVDNHGRLKR